jgi:hypothetical protein
LKNKPLGAYKLKDERIMYIDEAIAQGMKVPSPYNSPRLVKPLLFVTIKIGSIQASCVCLENCAYKEAKVHETRKR